MIRSAVFTISRPQLVRAASEQYLRRIWPIFVAFPLFGISAMVFGPNTLVKAIGFFALLWPFSIPARVAFASWGKAKKLMRPTWISLDEDALYFHDESGGGMKLPLEQIRRLDHRGPYYVFETRAFNFALVPVDAIAEADRAHFESGLGRRVK